MELKALWDFMQVDMAADNFEAEMRKSPNRQKLIKRRNFLMEQQANMKKIEGEIAVMQDRLEAVRDEAQRLEGVLSATLEDISANPPATLEETQRKMDAVQKLSDTLSHYEQELSKMRKDAENRDHMQREIRVRAARTKAEYDQLKQEYDVEFKRETAELKNMRAGTDAEAAKIDPELMEKYMSIKQHCTPPMAKLIDGQCSGCFMSLPSATLLSLKEGDQLVLCDNCGRIIYCEE